MNRHNFPQWRGMDAATRSVAYSPSSALNGPLDPFIEAYSEMSRRAYAVSSGVKTISYGGKASNTIDFVAPETNTPVPLHVFFHGGYWQELSKRESFFPAIDTLSRGMAFAAVDYTLAPKATLDDIVAECRTALSRLFDLAIELNIDPARFVLSGSSAGAQLAAMACLGMEQGFRPNGLVLMSGIYDLEPLIGTYINDALGMDVPTARRNSPIGYDLGGFPQTVLAWGEQETDEFKRQSHQFEHLLLRAGVAVQSFEMTGRNHFDILEDLANDSALGQALVNLAGDR